MKAPSAEIGQNRYYHFIDDPDNPCGCDPRKPDPQCVYSLPSVTTILKTLPAPWLGAWAAKMVAQFALDNADNLATLLAREGREEAERYLKGAPWRKRDAAAERGTAVHAAAETGAALEDVPDNARSRVVQWHRWLDDHKPETLHQEATVYNTRVGYAGTLDLIGRIGVDNWLLDIKTTDDLNKLKWDWRLQLAAYRNATYLGNLDTPMPRIDRTGIILLADDGYRFLEISAGSYEFAAFRTLVTLRTLIEPLMGGQVGRDVA